MLLAVQFHKHIVTHLLNLEEMCQIHANNTNLMYQMPAFLQRTVLLILQGIVQWVYDLIANACCYAGARNPP